MTKEHGGYLLLVEDSLDQREAMQAALEIEGYHVIAVPGGQDALDHLRGAASPCLILLDLMMPGKNGRNSGLSSLRIPGSRRFPSLSCRATGGYGRRLLHLA